MNEQSPKIIQSDRAKDRQGAFNEISSQLGRAFAVYFAWLSVGLLDRQDEPKVRGPACDRSS